MTSQLTEQPTGEPIDLNAGCQSNTENPGPRVCGVTLRANPVPGKNSIFPYFPYI